MNNSNWPLDELTNREYANNINKNFSLTNDLLKAVEIEARKGKVESDIELFHRMRKMREYLVEFNQKENREGKKVLIVSHGYALSALLSDTCTTDSRNGKGLSVSAHSILNAQMEPFYLNTEKNEFFSSFDDRQISKL